MSIIKKIQAICKVFFQRQTSSESGAGFIALIVFSVSITIVGSWVVVSAQTWIMSPSPPPDNTTVQTIQSGSGDNLGLNNPHEAGKLLRLSPDTNPGYRIYGIGDSGADPALQVSSDKMGVSLGATDFFALKSVTLSNNSAYSGLHTGNGQGYPSLIADSASHLSAQLFGLTNVSSGLIFGNNLNNLLSANAQTNNAENNLYWGSNLLCDVTLPNCGWILAGAAGDGLGNHIATQTLNMSGKTIFNIGSNSLNGADAAIIATGTLASTTISAISADQHGIFTQSTAGTSAHAGLYATSTKTGLALLGASTLGNGGRSYGPLEIMNYNGTTSVKAQIQFGPDSKNNLNVSALAGNPTSNLYWGNALLCDASKVNCGWAQGSGTPGKWEDNPKGIHYPADPSGVDSTKGVLIGRAADTSVATKLDIGHSYVSGEPSSRYNLSDITPTSGTVNAVVVRDSTAYVATSNSLQIYNISVAGAPVSIGRVAIPSPTWGLTVSGRYAYLATTIGLRVVDIYNPSLPTPVGSSAALAGVSASLYATDVQVVGHYAILLYDLTVGGGGLQVIDITKPSAPVVKKTMNSSANLDQPRGLSILGNDVAIADTLFGLKVYRLSDLLDPSQPSPAPRLSTPSTLSSVVIRGSYIYGAGDSLYVFNLSDGVAAGRFSDDFNTPAYGLQVIDDYAYVLSDGLQIFNINDPANTGMYRINNTINPYDAGDAGKLAIAGRWLYLADRTNNQLSIRNNQGLQVSSAVATNGTFDTLSVLGNMDIAGNVTAKSIGVGVRGLTVMGSVDLNASGLQLQDLALDKTALDKIFTKCRSVATNPCP